MDTKQHSVEHIETTGTESENDPTLEKSLKRKWDTRILPCMFLVYFCSFMDRANIANASIAGLTKDLHLEGRSYNVALALFFVVYMVADLPAAWIFGIVGRGRFIATCVTGWAAVTVGMGFITTGAELYTLRCLLGLFEGGMTACLFLYLSLFYTRYELQTRIAWFYISGPLSNAVGGLLASGLERIHVGKYRNWRWIFIIEGAFTVFVGLTCFFALPNWPSKARYLTPEEKTLAECRASSSSNTYGHDGERQQNLTWKSATRGIFDWNTALIGLASLGIYSNIYGYSLFSPVIIESFGFSVIDSQLLSAPPFVVAAVYILLTSYLSDRIKMRGVFIIAGSLLQAVGWILQLTCKGIAVRYFGLFLIACGSFGSIPSSTAWIINNVQPQLSRASATATTVSAGTLGGIVATFTYIGNQTDATGNAMQIGLSGLTILCVGALIVHNNVENSKRAKGYRDYRLTDGKVPVDDLGSHHPAFRHSL